jgi:RNA polymerase sigma factor (sigma-70 family)
LPFLKNISSADSDNELVARYKASGEPDILGKLYQRYMDTVYGVCLKYLKEPEDAKDCVLNIFEELITKLKKHEVDNFGAWLYRLTKNHCLMKLRKRNAPTVNIDLSLMQSEQNIHPELEIEKEANFKQMQYCLEQLIPAQREAIELFYLKNKCYKEIAGTTGIDVNKVRSFIQNGRRNLKICMESKMQQLK